MYRSPPERNTSLVDHAIAKRIVLHIANSIHGDISVANAASVVLASTRTSLIGQTITTADTAQRVACDDLMLPLTHAEQRIGSIILHNPPQSSDEVAAVVQALAGLIVQQATVLDQTWMHNTFIHDLVHGQLAAEPTRATEEAMLLGIDLDVPRSVVVVYIKPAIDRMLHADGSRGHERAADDEQQHAHLLHTFRHSIRANSDNLFGFLDDHRLLGLLVVEPRDHAAEQQRLAQHVRQFLDTIHETLGVQLCAGIGTYHPGWPALARSGSEALFALYTGRMLHGDGGVYSVFGLGLAALVLNNDQRTRALIARHFLDSVVHTPELHQTLEAFLDAGLSPSVAAQRLHIHRHTLAYRLDKIASMTGLDPRQFQAAAQLAAALLVYKQQHAGTPLIGHLPFDTPPATA